jgi:hypothetical protein
MIIDNRNRFIQPEEVIFHVGDLALGKKDKLEGLAALLNVQLHLCRVFRRIGLLVLAGGDRPLNKHQ